MSGLKAALYVATALSLSATVAPACADTIARAERGWAAPGGSAAAATPASPAAQDDLAWLPKDAPPAQPFSRIDALVPSAPAQTAALALPQSTAPQAPAPFAMPAPTLAPPPAAAPTAAAPTGPAQPFAMPAAVAATPAPAAAPAQPQQAEQPAIDLTALRYYASKNDIARVAAEIRRIRSNNPSWTPPETLFSEPVAAVDEQPMWNLYGKGDLEAIYRLIEAEKAKNPRYVPSADLVQKLKSAEARRAIQASVDAKQYDRVLAIAGQIPELMVCGEMQVLWNVSEAYARTKVPSRAFALYSYILTSCNDPGERFATVQKAAQMLPEAALPHLVRLGRANFDGSGEFDGILLDTVRRRVGDAMSARKSTGAAPAEIEQLKASAATPGHEDDAILLAWYYYNKKDFAESKQWFDRVLQTRFDLKAVEGYILALRENKENAEARDLALEYSSQGFSIAKLYIEIASSELTDDDPTPVPEATLTVLKAVIEEHKSALGAQSLAWYLYNNKDPKAAREWFEKSVAWEPTEEGILGLAIAQNKLGNRKAVKELAATYGDNFPTLDAFVDRIGPDSSSRPARTAAAPHRDPAPKQAARSTARNRASGGDPLMKEALASYEAGKFDDAIEKLDARRAQKGETRDVAVLRGWALHNGGRHKDAFKLFTKLEKERSTKETRAAVRYSWERMMPPRFRY